MLQNTIHDVLRWSNVNRFKRNSLKCKELRIDFRRESNLDTVSLEANGNAFEIVKSAKILGVTVRLKLFQLSRRGFPLFEREQLDITCFL